MLPPWFLLFCISSQQLQMAFSPVLSLSCNQAAHCSRLPVSSKIFLSSYPLAYLYESLYRFPLTTPYLHPAHFFLCIPLLGMCFHHHASLSFHTLTPSSQILPRIYFLTESKVSLLDIPHKHHVADYFPYLSPNRQQFTFFFLLQTSFVPCAFTFLPPLLLHTLRPPCTSQYPCMSLSYHHPASSLHLFQSLSSVSPSEILNLFPPTKVLLFLLTCSSSHFKLTTFAWLTCPYYLNTQHLI